MPKFHLEVLCKMVGIVYWARSTALARILEILKSTLPEPQSGTGSVSCRLVHLIGLPLLVFKLKNHVECGMGGQGSLAMHVASRIHRLRDVIFGAKLVPRICRHSVRIHAA